MGKTFCSKEKFVITETDYRDRWLDAFRSVFRPPGDAVQPRWIPEDVFQPGFRYRVLPGNGYVPSEEEYESLRSAMRQLGEAEFVVRGAEVQFGTRDEHQYLRYDTSCSWSEYIQHHDVSTFFLVVQRTEYYLHGHRHDWGFVGSQDLNVGILGYRSKEAQAAFTGPFIEDPNRVRDEYLTDVPDAFRSSFEKNYPVH